MYNVNEVFLSIQGEGLHVGQPMVFVRFSGCNLSCDFCDTEHETGVDMSLDELVAEVTARLRGEGHDPWAIPVCFTGGEPLLQVDHALVDAFQRQRFPVHIETNGTMFPPVLNCFDVVTVSPKTLPPVRMRSETVRKFFTPSPGRLRVLKLLWCEVPTREFLTEMMTLWGHYPWNARYLQPITYPDGTTNALEVVAYLRSHPKWWRLSVQLHRMLSLR